MEARIRGARHINNLDVREEAEEEEDTGGVVLGLLGDGWCLCCCCVPRLSPCTYIRTVQQQQGRFLFAFFLLLCKREMREGPRKRNAAACCGCWWESFCVFPLSLPLLGRSCEGHDGCWLIPVLVVCLQSAFYRAAVFTRQNQPSFLPCDVLI